MVTRAQDELLTTYRPDLFDLAARYAENSVMVTTAELDLPGPQILYVNSAFTKMTGYSASELLGRTPRIFQGPKTDLEILRNLKEALHNGDDFIARAINYRQDGSEFMIEWIINHIRDENGISTHYVALQRDITGQERAEKELHKFNEELRDSSRNLMHSLEQLRIAEKQAIDRERLAALGYMSGSVVHDLRNALVPLIDTISQLGASDNLTENQMGLVSILNAGTEHAVHLLGNLRYFYGNEPIEKETVDLRALLTRVSQITKSKWDSKLQRARGKIDVVLDIQEDMCTRGNSTELTQVVVNLVFNALDAMPTGGTLTLHAHQESDSVIIDVSDTGQGMAKEMQERCFEPYTTGKASGSGLGLSVCKTVVERHGGTIVLIESKDSRTRFRISLPGLPADEANLVDRQCSQKSIRPIRILSVEDDASCGKALKRLLTSMGHEVVVVESGDAGIEAFYKEHFDLVMTDLELSLTNGIDVCRMVKSTRVNVPVIITSGRSHDEVHRLFQGHGCPDAVLEKPFQEDALALALTQCLKESSF